MLGSSMLGSSIIRVFLMYCIPDPALALPIVRAPPAWDSAHAVHSAGPALKQATRQLPRGHAHSLSASGGCQARCGVPRRDVLFED